MSELNVVGYILWSHKIKNEDVYKHVLYMYAYYMYIHVYCIYMRIRNIWMRIVARYNFFLLLSTTVYNNIIQTITCIQCKRNLYVYASSLVKTSLTIKYSWNTIKNIYKYMVIRTIKLNIWKIRSFINLDAWDISKDYNKNNVNGFVFFLGC